MVEKSQFGPLSGFLGVLEWPIMGLLGISYFCLTFYSGSIGPENSEKVGKISINLAIFYRRGVKSRFFSIF